MNFNSYDNIKIKEGLNILLTLDWYLLANELNEPSITHKLAEHYQHLFHEWNVDCEYNLNLEEPKEIFFNTKKILQQMANALESNKYLLNNREIDFEHTTMEQMKDLERQLRHPELEFAEELGVVYFILTLSDNNKVRKTIFPDIIIHQRGTTNNHIVIEAKKTTNTDVRARGYDLVKLINLVSSPDFHYRRGYFIDLPVGNDFSRFEKFLSPKEFNKGVYIIKPKWKVF